MNDRADATGAVMGLFVSREPQRVGSVEGGPDSRNTSIDARSSSATAPAPTQLPAGTGTLASAAPCCRSTRP